MNRCYEPDRELATKIRRSVNLDKVVFNAS
mgnify:CR=1 FL=1